MERAKTILTETLFTTSNGKNDLIHLPGGRSLIPDSLIYRLTFDQEDYDDDELDDYHDDCSQLFTHNQLHSIDHDGNMINVWTSSNWDTKTDHYNSNNNININIEHDKLNEPESMIKSNVSSLADEIIDSEMNSLKCLQIQSSQTQNVSTINGNPYDQPSPDNEVNYETIKSNDSVKSTGQCPSNRNNRMKSLILPLLMRGTINTETPIITYDCPPTGAFLSCCVIS